MVRIVSRVGVDRFARKRTVKSWENQEEKIVECPSVTNIEYEFKLLHN